MHEKGQLDADNFPIGVKVSNQHLVPRGLIRQFTAMMRLLLNEDECSRPLGQPLSSGMVLT